MLWSFGRVRATMLRQGMRTSSIFNSQHAAIRRNMVAKCAQHAAPNNVAKCCVHMLRSFGRGFKLRPNDRNISQHCWPSICMLQPNDRNISAQHIATLLGATCCTRLAPCCNVLRHVGLVFMPECNIVARTWPNNYHNIMQHPQILHEKFDHFQN